MSAVRGWAAVVLAAAGLYAAFTLTALALHDWNPLWFVWIGERYAYGDPHGRTGYDGQFVYYIARDGWAAAPHLDNPRYRLGRILYPALVRALSGGDTTLLPWLMVVVNAVAITITTALLTRWLIAGGVPRWYGLVYPLYAGTVMAYSRDLTEPLAYGLAAAGALAWLTDRRAAAVALLALAGLTREATVLFPAGLAMAELLGRRWRRAAELALAAIPVALWAAYLTVVIAPAERPLQALSRFTPLALLTNVTPEIGRVSSLVFIAVPLLLLAPIAAGWIARTPRDGVAWIIALNITLGLLVPSGVHAHIFSASRTMSGVLVALVLRFPDLSPRFRAVVAAAAVFPTAMWLPPLLWWAPWTATV